MTAEESNYRAAAGWAGDAKLHFLELMQALTNALRRASMDSGRWTQFKACIDAFEVAQRVERTDNAEFKRLMRQYDKWRRIVASGETSYAENKLMTAIHTMLTDRHFVYSAVETLVDDPATLSDWRHHHGIATDEDYEEGV